MAETAVADAVVTTQAAIATPQTEARAVAARVAAAAALTVVSEEEV